MKDSKIRSDSFQDVENAKKLVLRLMDLEVQFAYDPALIEVCYPVDAVQEVADSVVCTSRPDSA